MAGDKLQRLAELGRKHGASGPWLNSWDMSPREWSAYITGVYRSIYPGSGNRRQRRGYQ